MKITSVLTVLLVCCFNLVAQAQIVSNIDGMVSPGIMGGNPPSSYALSGIDHVNFYNGNLNVVIPLLTVGGRGNAGYTMVVPIQRRWSVQRTGSNAYEPYSWSDPFSQLDYSPMPYSPGTLVIRRASGTPGKCLLSGKAADLGPYVTRLVWVAADGTETVLRDAVFDGQSQGSGITDCNAVASYTPANRSTKFTSSDASDLTFVASQNVTDSVSSAADDGKGQSGTLFFPNGTKYTIDSGGEVTQIEDRNGNLVQLSYPNGNTLAVDPLGRSITTTRYYSTDGTGSNDHDTIAFQGFNGANRDITVKYKRLTNALESGSVQALSVLFPSLPGAPSDLFNPNVITSVVLPDSSSYTFQYNSYGEVTTVTLPTGGKYHYTFQGISSDGSGVIPISQYTGYSIYRRVVQRDEYSDGSTHTGQITFEASAAPGSDPHHAGRSGTLTTVKYTDPRQTQTNNGLLRQETHHFYGDPSAANSIPSPTDYPAWTDGLEFQTEMSDGSKTWQKQQNVWTQRSCSATEHCWYNPSDDTAPAHDPQLCQTNTTLDSGGAAGSIVAYDPYNNITDRWEYDYGAAPAIGASCSSPIAGDTRHTHTDYLTQSPYTDQSTYIFDLPSQTTVTADVPVDNGGAATAQIKYSYDEYTTNPIFNAGNIVGHDNANYAGGGARGNLTTLSQCPDPANCKLLTTSFSYDIAGNLRSVTDANSHSTQWSYDDSNNTYAHVTGTINAQKQKTAAAYDYYSSQPTSFTDRNSIETDYDYSNDPLDRLKKVTVGGTVMTTFAYPSLTQTIRYQSQTAGWSLRIDTWLDGLGRVIDTDTYEDGSKFISSTQNYDALGRPWTATNPSRSGDGLNFGTTTLYDPLNRPTQVTLADSSVETTSYSGNQVVTADPANKKKSFTFDALGRLTGVTEDPDGQKFLTTYHYDILDNLTTVLQGSQKRTFAHDSLGRLIYSIQPESGTINYRYDGAGNVVWRDDARGRETCYAYDALNRLTQQVYYTGVGQTGSCPEVPASAYDPSTPNVTYAYDDPQVANSVGHLTQVFNANATTNYTAFDVLGNVTRSNQAVASTGLIYPFQYTYNLASSLTSETYPSGRVVTTDYDPANRVKQVSGQAAGGTPQTYWSNPVYAPHGAPVSYVYGNQISRTLVYNSLLQTHCSTDTDATTGGILFQQILDYGPNQKDCTDAGADGVNNGNITSLITKHGGPGYPQFLTFTQSFIYDAVNRLHTASESGDWNRTFQHDQYGNQWTDPNGSGGLVLDPRTPQNAALYTNCGNNQISSSPCASGAASPAYDAAGNQTAYGTFTLTYDAENRQIQIADNAADGGGQVAYAYDGAGQRVQKAIGNNQTIYVYDAFGLLAAEYSNVASSSPCSPCYLITDQLGSTRLVTDANRNVLARHDYLPFGEEVPANQAGRDSHWGPGNDAIAQKFTGQERDAEGPEFDFFQARYYSGTQGRFNSPDPGNAGADLTNPQSWNAYAYVLNNPLSSVDPDGLDSITASTPGFDLSGHPTTSGGGAPSTLGFGGGGGFGFSWGGGVPKVLTIKSPGSRSSQFTWGDEGTAPSMTTAWKAALSTLGDFLGGFGPAERIYEPSSVDVRSFMRSGGAAQMNQSIRRGLLAGNAFGHGSVSTPQAAMNVPFDLLHSPVGLQVGAYNYSWNYSSYDSSVSAIISNRVSLNSFALHLVPNHKRLPVSSYWAQTPSARNWSTQMSYGTIQQYFEIMEPAPLP